MAEIQNIPVHVLIAAGAEFEFRGEVLPRCTYKGEQLGIQLEEVDGEVKFSTPFHTGNSVISLPRDGLLAINVCKLPKNVYIWGNYLPGSNEPTECHTCCGQTVYGNQICQADHD